MNKTILSALLLSASFAGNTAVAANTVPNEAVVPARMRADPTDPAQNVEGAVYFNTATQKHRVFRGGAWHDLASGGEEPLLAGSAPCDAANAGKKALTVDIANAPTNTFPPAPPYVATIRWATCTSSVYRGRTLWFWQ